MIRFSNFAVVLLVSFQRKNLRYMKVGCFDLHPWYPCVGATAYMLSLV